MAEERNVIGLFEEVFAENGDRAPIPTGFDLGFGPEYALTESPDRRNMNDILAKVCAVATDVNKWGGGLPWSDQLHYKAGASVLHNGIFWIALLDNDGITPVDGSGYWTTLYHVMGLKMRQNYVRLMSHPDHGLYQSASGTYHYEVTKFTIQGTGTPVLSREDLIGIYVEANTGASTWESNVSAIIPDGRTVKLCKSAAYGSGDSTGAGTLTLVPISTDQEWLTLILEGESKNFTVLGALIRVP